jgi:hypothetical protein
MAGRRELTPFTALPVCLMPVVHWRGLTPPGRFLTKTAAVDRGGASFWKDVGDKAAQKRASKSLGERDMKRKRGEMDVSPSPSSKFPPTIVGSGRFKGHLILGQGIRADSFVVLLLLLLSMTCR